MKNHFLFLFLLMGLFGCSDYEKPPLVERSLEETLILSRKDGKYDLATTASVYDVFSEEGNSILNDGVFRENYTNEYKIFKASVGVDTFYLGERNLNVEGVPNLRDVGGLINQAGYQIKWGKIFRSGKLSEVDKGAFDRLAALNLKTIVDFRTQTEKEEDPDRWPNIDQINTIELPIGDMEGKSTSDMLKEIQKEGFDADKFMHEVSKGFILDYAYQYKEFFQILLDESNYPLLFHCSAGKDRAGFGSYLIQSALGVDIETKLQEYLLSNFYLQHTSEKDIKKAATFLGIDQDKLRTLMKVKPEYMQGALDAIKEEYGNLVGFLCDALEMCDAEIEQLKKIMLYDYKAIDETSFDELDL